MGVTNGEIKVSINITGQGDGPKKVEDTAKALDKVDKSSTQAAGGVNNLTARVGALKTGVGPVNMLREGFEFLRSNIGFLGTAIASATAVFGALFSLLSSDTSIDEYAAKALTAATNSHKLSSELSDVAAKARGAVVPLAQMRKELLGLVVASAKLAGDDDRADFLVRQAGAADAAKTAEDAGKKLVDDKQKMWTAENALKKAEANAASLQRTRDGLIERINKAEAGRLVGLPGSVEDTSGWIRALVETDVALTHNTAVVAGLKQVHKDLGEQVALSTDRLAALKQAADEASIIEMPELTFTPEKGPVRPPSPEQTLRSALLRGDQAAIDKAFAADRKGALRLDPGAANDNRMFDVDPDQIDAITRGQEAMQAYIGTIAEARELTAASDLGGWIRDFSAALSEAIPGMGAFSGALSEISTLWGEYAETGKGAARATILSVGAIARAGAEHIKNERLRAGVLAVIETGLGLGLMFVPGRQAEAGGHFAAAATLGAVAIFGSGSSSSAAGSQDRQRSFARPLSERTQSGMVVNNWWGPYIAPGRDQQSAAELHAIMGRGESGGWVPRAA